MASHRYTRASFPPLLFHPLHYDLVFDVLHGPVRVTATQTYMCRSDAPLSEMVLNAHNLDVLRVELLEVAAKLGPPPSGVAAQLPDFVAYKAEVDAAAERGATPLQFAVDRDARTVTVQLPFAAAAGGERAEFVIRTVSECTPTHNVLEGLYFDYTPEGAPQTLITQCQQYGFQRIVPCVDRMASKTFYTTTVVADARYTSVLSNGDVPDTFSDEHGLPRPLTLGEMFGEAAAAGGEATVRGGVVLRDSGGVERRVWRYLNHKVNMAPYLFFLGLGNYEVYRRVVEYAHGASFLLELMCFPGLVKPEHAEASLESLNDSVLWVHLSCGPEACDHDAERAQIYELIAERDELKRALAGGSLVTKGNATLPSTPDAAKEERLAAVRARLRELFSVWSEPGYEYKGKCYREIAMENSDYGGMENVGNTTIISSRLTPSDWLVDGGYIYMEGVKVHEFYHNINGSQVTGASPFEIWLNEAVTVHVQREREDVLFGHHFMRLRHLLYALMPGKGPLAQDRSPVSMAVEPDGFNTTHELISAMTYSKAPEFVRMCQVILGRPTFVRALENYHQKYAFSNATTSQWIAEMAALAPSSVDIFAMAKGWLKRTGYPTLDLVSTHFDAERKSVTVRVRQSGFEEHDEQHRYPWIFPIEWSAVRDGKDVATGTYVLQEASGEFVIEGVEAAVDYVSVARDWSFFGDVKLSAADTAEYVLRAKTETDPVQRYLAAQALFDEQRKVLIEALSGGEIAGARVETHIPELHAAILADAAMESGSKALLLSVPESAGSAADELEHLFAEIAQATTAIKQSMSDHHASELVDAMIKAQVASQASKGMVAGVGARMLSYACYGVLAAGYFRSSVLQTRPARPASPVSALAEAAKKAGHADFDVVSFLKGLLSSRFMSDKQFALIAILELPDEVMPKEERLAVQRATRDEWVAHPIGCEQYIAAVARVDCDTAPEYIRALLKEPFFNMNLAGHARTVARGWAGNPKRSMLTADGLDLSVELTLAVGRVNQMSAYSFIDAFSVVSKLGHSPHGTAVKKALQRVLDGLDKKEHESLYGRLSALLA